MKDWATTNTEGQAEGNETVFISLLLNDFLASRLKPFAQNTFYVMIKYFEYLRFNKWIPIICLECIKSSWKLFRSVCARDWTNASIGRCIRRPLHNVRVRVYMYKGSDEILCTFCTSSTQISVTITDDIMISVWNSSVSLNIVATLSEWTRYCRRHEWPYRVKNSFVSMFQAASLEIKS